jgi:hypothetical protein
MQADFKSDSRGAIGVGHLSNQHSLIAPVLEASARMHNDPEYRRKVEQAASTPINIAVMTGLFWQLPTTHTDGCNVDGIPLECHIQMGGSEVSSVSWGCSTACHLSWQYCRGIRQGTSLGQHITPWACRDETLTCQVMILGTR